MFIHAPQLKKLPHVRHAFFTREQGVSDGIYASLNGGVGSSDSRDNVFENRRRMAMHLGVSPEGFLGVYQIHSSTVVTVRQLWDYENRPKADAMVTNKPEIALTIATADCGPVLFADKKNGVIGAAHAGWKGALGGILEATIAAMETLGAERSCITAVLGPTITQPNYEVGAEFPAPFLERNADAVCFFKPSVKPDRWLFNLPGYILNRLMLSGVEEASFLGECTYADEFRFYSYRRSCHRNETDYGRLISALCLTP